MAKYETVARHNMLPSGPGAHLCFVAWLLLQHNVDGVHVHVYDNPEMSWTLKDGNKLTIKQTTNYPWKGKINITFSPATPSEFVARVRIPERSTKFTVKRADLPIRRCWPSNDNVEMGFDMTPEINPAVHEGRDRIAFRRGQIVFCIEHFDQSNE